MYSTPICLSSIVNLVRKASNLLTVVHIEVLKLEIKLFLRSCSNCTRPPLRFQERYVQEYHGTRHRPAISSEMREHYLQFVLPAIFPSF